MQIPEQNGRDAFTEPEVRDIQQDDLCPSSQVRASQLRLFLASPEASGLAALSTELRSVLHAVRCRRLDDIATCAQEMLAIVCAEEAASTAVT